nr:MAG TPA: Primase-pol, Primase, REPLICATION [Bacteriophage sp.]
MRDKWNRPDYSERTINAGIEACNGVFHFSLNLSGLCS